MSFSQALSAFDVDELDDFKIVTDDFVHIRDLRRGQTKFFIKVRVTNKSKLLNYNPNPNQKGVMIVVDLVDENGSQITAKAFNSKAKSVLPSLHINGIYTIKNGRIQIQKPDNYYINPSKFQIVFDHDTIIDADEDDDSIPYHQFNFKTILDCYEKKKNDYYVDICGIIHNIEDLQKTVDASQKPFIKRTIVIRDDTHYTIGVTLWDTNATNDSYKKGDVIIIQKGKFNVYDGLTTISAGSQVEYISPEDDCKISRVNELFTWWHKEGNKDIKYYSNSGLQPYVFIFI